MRQERAQRVPGAGVVVVVLEQDRRDRRDRPARGSAEGAASWHQTFRSSNEMWIHSMGSFAAHGAREAGQVPSASKRRARAEMKSTCS